MPSEGMEEDEWNAYVTLDTYNKDVPRDCLRDASPRVGWEAGAVVVDSVSSFPPSNRACGSPTHGFPTSFTVGHAQSGSSELFR
jgi:hypothetical protein